MTLVGKFSDSFDSSSIEQDLRAYWQEHQFYRSSPRPDRKPYTIVMPPPNITGDLTVGHMMFTLQDILIRWHRAQGYEVCWIPGVDHASISTEMKVTKMLAERGIDKQAIGREKFLEHVWEWKEKYGDRIVESLKMLGISCDWSRKVFTMDEKYTAAVTKSIVQLYRDGLIYSSQRLVNWCPVSQSVISDEEVNMEERQSSLWYIRYDVVGEENSSIVVATTRPETLFGDLAVAVHPDDPRYKHLVGKEVLVPVCNRVVPVLADSSVEMEFGTGAVKITPAHDKNDFELGRRHKLDLINIMLANGRLNEEVSQDYIGLDRFVAREKLVQELADTGFLEKTVPYKVTLGISERGGVPIEYMLSEQWYIKMKGLAQKALAATRSQRLKLIPAFQEKVWEHWLANIQDWCISRQLWWGHRLPIYTCVRCDHTHCIEIPPTSCVVCGYKELLQDDDVIDTWASAWLWPFGVHNWARPNAEEQQDLSFYYPTATLVTGADIIFFWVARMVMAGEYFTGKLPFQSCYFTPIVRDSSGRKMSKSLGNSPDVMEIMRKYGTDAMRFSLVNQIVTGQDLHWRDESCQFGKNFVNKIWNVTRFLCLNAEKFDLQPGSLVFEGLAQRSADPLLGWVTSEFFSALQQAHDGIAQFEFSRYTSALYEFVWMVYCDWFVELIKPRLGAEENPQIARESLTVAMQIFDGLLRILHPVIPFVTEHIWRQLNVEERSGKTVGLEPLPAPNSRFIDSASIRQMRDIQNVVGAVRTIRGQFNIHPATELKVCLERPIGDFGDFVPQLQFLAKAKFFFATAPTGFFASVVVSQSPLYVSLEGLVDPAVECDRLRKKIEKVCGILVGLEKKLANVEFVRGAPPQILEGARAQLETNKKELHVLEKSLAIVEQARQKKSEP